MTHTDLLSARIAEALVPISEEFGKDFHISADGVITELDRSLYVLYNKDSFKEGVSPLTCGSNQCEFIYSPCSISLEPNVKPQMSTFCVSKGASETKISEVYEQGRIVCKAIVYSCPK